MKIYKNYFAPIPRFYGYAYSLIEVNEFVAYPIPLNFFARWARLFLRYFKCPSFIEFEPSKNFKAGYEAGFEDGEAKASNKFLNTVGNV